MSLTECPAYEIAKTASVASRHLATLADADRKEALTALHDALLKDKNKILEANARDLEIATKAAENGDLSQSVLRRLDLSKPGKYDDMLNGILGVRDLDDPIGKVTLKTLIDDGLILEKVSCPIGVLLIIFEARPEVIANIAALAIKSGNAAILKGGKESTESFVAISNVISETIAGTKVPQSSIQLVKTRDIVSSLLEQDSFIDLVIPRGSNDLVRFVKDNTKIAVLGHADGLCSAYIHSDADQETALRVVVDSKTDYPAACNSLETLLVHQDVLGDIFPAVAEALFAKGVSLRCDASSRDALLKTLKSPPPALIQSAVDSDYQTEFLDLVLAVKTIAPTPENSALETAIAHINSHSSRHTDVIVTSSRDAAQAFMHGVDSAGVFWNASSRFADGMRYGFGTEVGISTNKIHSRGPVGLDGLTIYKYLVRGAGHRACDYSDVDGSRTWKHQNLPLC
ncbi:gamma-glutamyl phosphate reductase [Aspergillus steynii IBT 23096]|uniref:glutamate-5-semialdehyde dehydrogenase n=1 Tax=Aspergillus steynii IBT 23096 TaxID=1392250 RepID=A0A2I2G298_9EURO|nr:gamma-glutamyl phosphate reductase [Aspergillus steynii IBT 23096]PLB47008.1 gamma-glutamyl phosphate reductase [Aspergillus steynii IBT 23096]